ncbi:hypothetical protein ACMA1I_20675 [Pontibacter sp. 13R65]
MEVAIKNKLTRMISLASMVSKWLGYSKTMTIRHQKSRPILQV